MSPIAAETAIIVPKRFVNWNAAAAGITAEQMMDVLHQFTKFPLPANLHADLKEVVSRYGRIRLEKLDDKRAPSAVRRRALSGFPELSFTEESRCRWYGSVGLPDLRHSRPSRFCIAWNARYGARWGIGSIGRRHT